MLAPKLSPKTLTSPMEAVSDEWERERSNENIGNEGRKFKVGQKVEVLYFVKDSYSAWIMGVVTDCQTSRCVVELSNVMRNGICCKVVLSVPVLEGECCVMEENYNGNIRPLPPHHNLRDSEITYGLCVDAFIGGTWREGVVVDQMDSTEKLILFPDTNDEDLIPAYNLRLTQEWSEVSGSWRCRGHWFFLQIIGKFEQQKLVMPDRRVLWFRLKSWTTFHEKIKVWYTGSEIIWKELLLDIIQGRNLAITSFPATDSSSGVQLLNGCCPHQKNGGSHGVVTNKYIQKPKCAEPEILASECGDLIGKDCGHCVSPDKESSISSIEADAEMKEVDGHGEVEEFGNHGKAIKSVISSVCGNKFSVGNKKAEKHLASILPHYWKPVKLEGECCNDALKVLFVSHVERKKHWRQILKTEKMKLKKFLVFIGWRIESKRDTFTRFRYISPDKSIHYSLANVCEYLFKERKNMSAKGRDKSNSWDTDLNNDLPEIHSAKTELFSLKCAQKAHPTNDGLSSFQQTAKLLCRTSDSSEVLKWKFTQAISSYIAEENEQTAGGSSTTVNENLDSVEDARPFDLKSMPLSEGVITEYMHYNELPKDKQKLLSVDVKALRSNTKNYLLKKGWKLWLFDKKVRGGELRYTSPNGRTYISLYTACRGYLGEVRPKCAIKRSSKCMNGDKSVCGPSNNLSIAIFNERKEVYEKDLHFVQKEGLDQGPSCSSNMSDSGECDSNRQRMGRSRELQGRNIKYPKTKVALDKRLPTGLIANDSNQKHAEKIEASTSHKPLMKSYCNLHSGKRSRWAMFLSSRDQAAKTVLTWLIDNGVVLPREKVAYVRKTDGHIMKIGWITQDGIKCRCCLNVFSLSKFEFHAGCKTGKPCASIKLQDGRSLLDCQKKIVCDIDLKKYHRARLKSNNSENEADDVCTVCQDGGMLMLCDLCPSAFHPTCVGLEDVPQGDWFCPSCRCGICGLSEFNCDTEKFTTKSGIYCDQCEREYHVGCLQNQGRKLQRCPTGAWTCSEACFKISDRLGFLLGKSNHTPVKGLSWTILRSNGEKVGKFEDEAIAENYGWLHIALDVLHECFETMVENRTRSDIAADILFNRISELNRLNFWGFYTMLLMWEDELVCVATFRVFGERLAELPFICTRVKFRRQGMCRLLMDELQKLLSSLGVRRLLLPAVPELLKTWTSSFGFTKMSSSEILELLEHTFLTFKGTSMCQKFLKEPS